MVFFWFISLTLLKLHFWCPAHLLWNPSQFPIDLRLKPSHFILAFKILHHEALTPLFLSLNLNFSLSTTYVLSLLDAEPLEHSSSFPSPHFSLHYSNTSHICGIYFLVPWSLSLFAYGPMSSSSCAQYPVWLSGQVYWLVLTWIRKHFSMRGGRRALWWRAQIL